MIDHILDTSKGDILLQVPAPIAGGMAQCLGLSNMTASSDPGVSQDNTQGYIVGSVLFNNTPGQLRFWQARDVTTGAAKWVYMGADYANGGTNPSTEITQFGGAPTAQMAEEGNINRQVTSAGVQPASTAADIVLAVYTLPAGAFDLAGRGLNIQACGSFASNTNSKRTKVIINPTSAVVGSAVVGGTTIADSGVVNTTAAAGGWSLTANVFKTGANGSNTQLAIHEAAQSGNAVGALLSPAPLTITESGAITIAITGNAATATTDITFNFLDVNAMN